MLYSVLVIVLFSLTNKAICNDDEEIIKIEIPKKVEDAIAQYLSSEHIDQSSSNGLERDFSFPGTNWCGPGNTAKNEEHLGTFNDTDKCCHAHDRCEPAIGSGYIYNNLHNDGKYTRLHCDCDEEFRKCLKNVNSLASEFVGMLYFNVIAQKCYREDYPIVGCKKRGSLVLGNSQVWFITKCVEYEFDYGSEKVYSWFDVPYY